MTSQAGWHPDPVPPPPGQPAGLRYWDGARWTEHTAPAPQPVTQPLTQPPAQPLGQTGPPVYAGTYAAPQPHVGRKPAATTPDGVPLAGWGQRVLAYLVDAVVVGVIAAVLALPWIRDMWEAYREWFRDALDTSATGSGTVDTGRLQRELAVPLAVTLAIQLGLGLCYHVGFLMWRQATPGKLLVGLRVRLRERPGPMPLGTVLLRWLGQFGVGVVNLVPFVGSLGGLYSLLDSLWPLWDDRRQAVHDKLARTNVVRVR